MSFFTLKNSLSFGRLNKSLLFALVLMIANIALAGATSDPLGERLCSILGIMMGPTAKAIATIAIIFVAIGLFAGRMTWLTVIPIIIGIIVIFAAPAIVQFISGGSGGTQCSTT